MTLVAEKLLWQAVLDRAIQDAKGKKSPHKERAQLWLKAGGPNFQQVCEMAGVDSDYVQRKLAGR